MRFAASVVPYELPAAVVRARVLVVPDAVALLSHTNPTRLSVAAQKRREAKQNRRTTGAGGQVRG